MNYSSNPTDPISCPAKLILCRMFGNRKMLGLGCPLWLHRLLTCRKTVFFFLARALLIVEHANGFYHFWEYHTYIIPTGIETRQVFCGYFLVGHKRLWRQMLLALNTVHSYQHFLHVFAVGESFPRRAPIFLLTPHIISILRCIMELLLWHRTDCGYSKKMGPSPTVKSHYRVH